MAPYKVPDAIGTQLSSKCAESPAWSIPRDDGKHERWASRGVGPGPQQYVHAGAIGPQATSNRGTQPTFSFGRSKREDVKKLHVSNEHDKLSVLGMASCVASFEKLMPSLESRCHTWKAAIFGKLPSLRDAMLGDHAR